MTIYSSSNKIRIVFYGSKSRLIFIFNIRISCSGTSQSFSNIPELWTIEGRTKSPNSQKSPTSSKELKSDLDSRKFIPIKDIENIDNNNTKDEMSCKGSDLVPTQDDQQEVEEAIDVLQNLDNWTE